MATIVQSSELLQKEICQPRLDLDKVFGVEHWQMELIHVRSILDGLSVDQESGLSINSCNRGASSDGTVATVDWSTRPTSMKSSRWTLSLSR
jgi:hypothetical protein